MAAFVPEDNGCPARVTHTRPHAHAHAVNDTTDGAQVHSGALQGAQPLHPSTALAFRPTQLRGACVRSPGFQIAMDFLPGAALARHRGQLPPARRARGGTYGCRCGAASSVPIDRVIERHFFSIWPKPNTGVGFRAILPPPGSAIAIALKCNPEYTAWDQI